MTRDDVVRGAVYRAFALRCAPGAEGFDAYKAAVAEIVELHAIWPLIELEPAFRSARRSLMLAQAKEAAEMWDDDSPLWVAA